ncbi:MAG: alpha/beta hydrolase [Aquisalinus sp.]|nr:alpha/beta hydrolase [Aquisalinus sp.]
MRLTLTIVKYLVFGLVALMLGAFLATTHLLDRAASYSDDANWFDNGRGIDAAEHVTIGGIDQYIRIRSRDADNPVMLDLHGGPGFPQSPWTYRYLRPLTEYFTLVEWDQRGTLRSPVPDELLHTMTYEQMVDDTIEVIEHLQETLNTDKVILVGHSWGSMLGIGVIKKRPDLIHAYVGVGQAVAWNRNFDETQRLLMLAAEEAGDEETLEALREIPKEWPPEEDVAAFFERVQSIQTHMVRYGTSLHASKSNDIYQSEIVLENLASPEVSLREVLALMTVTDAAAELAADLYGRDFRTQLGYDFDVPIILFQGDHDWQTPTTLAQDWFERINAPYKEYIAFEDSAHFVFNEEPGKYLVEMIETVRPFALAENQAQAETLSSQN